MINPKRTIPVIPEDVNRTFSIDVLKAIEGFAESQLRLLKTPKESWQPSDFLPDSTKDRWHDDVLQCRRQAEGLSDETLVVLVGDAITEEALPAYQTWLNRVDGIKDDTGTSDNPWARWTRGWTAEENRHGDLLNRYLYLTGRVDMRAIERTIQYLLSNGFNPHIGDDPYQALMYTSFQERATKISHGNVARLSQMSGDAVLAKICNMIAGDEARHEEAYKRFVKKIIEVDPNGSLLSFAALMRTRVVMPARLMEDDGDKDLFDRFSSVAQRIGVYTVSDYAANIEHLLDFWGIPSLTGLNNCAKEAQDYLCGLAKQYYRLADRAKARKDKVQKAAFSWIFGRSV